MNQVERIKKIYALAMQGVDGEKEQAQELLDKLILKYAISLDVLEEDKIDDYCFKYHGEEQKRILFQIIYKVTDSKDIFYSIINPETGRISHTQIGVSCTASQKVEIEFLFDFYKRLWEREKNALLEAFFQQHRLFGNLKEGEKPRELPPEELAKLYAMMSCLSNEEPLLQIEGGDSNE